jgi:hypothetical protein
MQVCCETGVSLLAYSPLAGGGLTGKYVKGTAGDVSRFNMFPGYMARYNKSTARDATMEYMQVHRAMVCWALLGIGWPQCTPLQITSKCCHRENQCDGDADIVAYTPSRQVTVLEAAGCIWTERRRSSCVHLILHWMFTGW